MNIVTITVIILRNVNNYEIMMGIYGFRRNRKRRATTTEKHKSRVYSMYSIPISPLVNNNFSYLFGL
jgi:hypothetical protein